MVRFNCQFCHYSVDKKSSWTIHLKSKKHTRIQQSNSLLQDESKIDNSDEYLTDSENAGQKNLLAHSEHTLDTQKQQKKLSLDLTQKMDNFTFSSHKNIKENKSIICNYCSKNFSRSSSLFRHINHYCRSKIMADAEQKFENEKLKMLLDVKNKEVNFLANELKDAKLNNKDQMSVLKTLMTHYQDNKPCKSIHCQLTAEFELEHFKATELLNTLEVAEPAVTIIVIQIDDIFYHYNHKILESFIGDKLISEYMKQNPQEQSVFSSDTTRLVFIVKVHTDNGDIWFKDKGGHKTKELIINSILKEIKEALQFYINYVNEHSHEYKPKKFQIAVSNAYKASKIQDDITNGALAQGIMRYIAPFFTLKNTITN